MPSWMRSARGGTRRIQRGTGLWLAEVVPGFGAM